MPPYLVTSALKQVQKQRLPEAMVNFVVIKRGPPPNLISRMYDVNMHILATPHWPRGHDCRVYDLRPCSYSLGLCGRQRGRQGDLTRDLGPTGTPHCVPGPLPSFWGQYCLCTTDWLCWLPSLLSPKEGLLLNLLMPVSLVRHRPGTQ